MLTFVISGIKIVSPFSFTIFFGFTPITDNYCPLVIFPENMRAKPKTVESSPSAAPASPLSLICFLEMVIIFDTNAINGAF